MTAPGRTTLIISASGLLVAIVVLAAIVTFAASPQSSPALQGSADTRSSAGATSTPSAQMTPAPGSSTKSPVTRPTPSSMTPAQARSTVAGVSKPAGVDVVTTFAGWNGLSHAVEVGGYAVVVEPVGTCTLRLSNAKKVVTFTHTATSDATTVACGGFSVPRSELSAGDWTAVLAYRSVKSTGESLAVTVKVP